MKKTLLIIGLFATTSLFAQTNLVLNSNCEAHIIDVNDNADSFDMTPPNDIDGATGNSPYTWSNTTLDSWLLANCGGGTDGNEQPGSSSDGNKFGTKAGLGRGVKLSTKCRRIYQPVTVTQGTTYTFSIDSRSEAANVPSEVFILNEAIENEAVTFTTQMHLSEYSHCEKKKLLEILSFKMNVSIFSIIIILVYK